MKVSVPDFRGEGGSEGGWKLSSRFPKTNEIPHFEGGWGVQKILNYLAFKKFRVYY